MFFVFLIALFLPASALDTIQYGAFTQTATYSIAQHYGFFAYNDLNVIFNQIPNSTFGYAQVLKGAYDILTGTIDNAVNLRFNQQAPLTVLGQLDQDPDLVLASVPSITQIDQLKGKTLIVDSPVSGFAYILRDVLSQSGLLLDRDYTFQTVGGTNLRYADLIAGTLLNGTTVYATILVYPFTAEGSVLPAGQQPNILSRVSNVIQPLSGSAFTAAQASLADSTKLSLLTRFMSSMYAANLFLANASKKNCATLAIADQLNVSVNVAKLEYTAAVATVTGETSSPGGNFTVNQQGLLNVINLRKEFGGFAGVPSGFNFEAAIVPGTGQLIDYSVRDAALMHVGSLNPCTRPTPLTD